MLLLRSSKNWRETMCLPNEGRWIVGHKHLAREVFLYLLLSIFDPRSSIPRIPSYRTIMLQRLALLLTFLLAACSEQDLTYVHIGDYEGPVGEALVRHMIKTMPDVLPGTPREYCVVTGNLYKAERPHSVPTDFVKRMDDMGVRFVSADVLVETPPNHDIVDPQTRISPYIIQLTLMRRVEPTVWEADVAWSFLKNFERKRFRVRTDAAGKPSAVEEIERVEGNYPPAAK
jgi:hypothetical protein